MDDTRWHSLRNWRPFNIDALGLVTLLGADEVDQALGSLCRRRITEFLPFLAAFVAAQDRFSKEQAGFALYNITDGIMTTELKGWFTRWLMSQNTLNATSIFRWKISEPRRRVGIEDFIAPIMAVVTVTPLLVITSWIRDALGIVNSVAIIISILVRSFILWQRRKAIDSVAAPDQSPKEQGKLPKYSEKTATPTESEESVVQLHQERSAPTAEDVIKILVTRADGKLVTVYAPRRIQEIFVREAKLPNPTAYHFARYVGWLAFGVQMVVLGMSSLFAQIYTVVLLVLSTWLMCLSLSVDTGTKYWRGISLDGTTSSFSKTNFGTKLEVEQENPREGEELAMDRRMHAFVRLQPNDKQESMLKHWSMLPFDGVPWYKNYHKAKTAYANQVRNVNLARSRPSSSAVSSGSGSSGSESSQRPLLALIQRK